MLRALSADPSIDEIVGDRPAPPAVSSAAHDAGSARDVARDDLVAAFRGVDAVVHLAWLIQPSRDRAATRSVNVDGSRRVFEAAAAAGVRTLVYASSVGAYSPGPKDRAVDESWPTGGHPTSFYSRDKADVERDPRRASRRRNPDMRVVRLRPGLIFKGEAASGDPAAVRRPAAARPRCCAGPAHPDRARASRGCASRPCTPTTSARPTTSRCTRDVRGAFNVAAEPVLDAPELARLLDARPVPVYPSALLRAAVDASWKLRLQPTPPGWLDLALGVPIMDTTRARDELGWTPVAAPPARRCSS